MGSMRLLFEGFKIEQDGDTTIVYKHDRPVFHVKQYGLGWAIYQPDEKETIFESLRIDGVVRWIKRQAIEGNIR